MEANHTSALVERLYAILNELERIAEGQEAAIRTESLAKLREVYLRARSRGNRRLYLQALRVHRRLAGGAAEDGQAVDPEGLAHHVVSLVTKTLRANRWTQGRSLEEISELQDALLASLKDAFSDRLA